MISEAPSLSSDDVERFSRQIMVEGIGACGMANIKAAHVVCVGAGGLGSTIALYLVAGGVGSITIIDFDDVELSNLHRQIIHAHDRIGTNKAESARQRCLELRPDATVCAMQCRLDHTNAVELFRGAQVIVDGSDNVAARYIINDAAMRCGVPLVSGSAMRWEAQLSVYGYVHPKAPSSPRANGTVDAQQPQEDEASCVGPCYRCVFPTPPPPAAVGSCNDVGVVGPVAGMMGCLQAMEVLKVLSGAGECLSGRLFIFDGLRFSSRVVKLRQRQMRCAACGVDAQRGSGVALVHRPEYAPPSCVVGAAYSHARLAAEVCCTPEEFGKVFDAGATTTLPSSSSNTVALCVDVRDAQQYHMAHLSWARSLPLEELQSWCNAPEQREAAAHRFVNMLKTWLKKEEEEEASSSSSCAAVEVYLICRRGVASTQALLLLQSWLAECGSREAGLVKLHNVDGGLNAYHHRVDASFPFY